LFFAARNQKERHPVEPGIHVQSKVVGMPDPARAHSFDLCEAGLLHVWRTGQRIEGARRTLESSYPQTTSVTETSTTTRHHADSLKMLPEELRRCFPNPPAVL